MTSEDQRLAQHSPTSHCALTFSPGSDGVNAGAREGDLQLLGLLLLLLLLLSPLCCEINSVASSFLPLPFPSLASPSMCTRTTTAPLIRVYLCIRSDPAATTLKASTSLTLLALRAAPVSEWHRLVLGKKQSKGKQQPPQSTVTSCPIYDPST